MRCISAVLLLNRPMTCDFSLEYCQFYFGYKTALANRAL